MRLFYSFFLIALGVLPIPNVNAENVTDGAAAKFFADMPLSTMELINRNRRLDMLDYYANDSICEVPNGMEGMSHLISVTPDYLKVSITPVSEMSITVLPLSKDTVYQTIYTLGSNNQAHDSQINFYTKDYASLPVKKFLKFPVLQDFILPKYRKNKYAKELVYQTIPFPTISFESEPTTKQLKARLTSSEIIGKMEFKKIEEFVTPELTYIWDGSKYELQKPGK